MSNSKDSSQKEGVSINEELLGLNKRKIIEYISENNKEMKIDGIFVDSKHIKTFVSGKDLTVGTENFKINGRYDKQQAKILFNIKGFPPFSREINDLDGGKLFYTINPQNKDWSAPEKEHLENFGLVFPNKNNTTMLVDLTKTVSEEDLKRMYSTLIKILIAKGLSRGKFKINSENKIDNGERKMKGNKDNPKHPLNLILYGPPGTGKTYNTVNKALEIIGEDLSGKDRQGIRTLFKKKADEGQIVFTTFHQSMSYEDFIEGIKPLEPEENAQFLSYEVVPGIFKQLCSDAKTQNNFDEIYDNTVKFIKTTGLTLKTVDYKKPFDVIINSNNSLVARPQTERSTEMCITKNMMREYFEEKYIRDWKSYIVPIAEYMEKKFGEVLFKKAVLIIDEINRGNISQIFGELITLIEKDKRVGEDESLELILPYSKEKFSVPSNLYIIGTMNTADRSVEALDTALRRRFCFEEMPPKPNIIAKEGKRQDTDGVVDGISLPKLLETINMRIEKLMDRDHKIGHSYFMSVEDLNGLKRVFQNNIIPLLQEYFFGDYGKIGLVLGKGFFEEIKDDGVEVFADFDGYDASGFDAKQIYKLRKCSDMNDGEFKNALIAAGLTWNQ
jgi:5-methylcytosine-specific restriction enzyme B